MGDPGVTDVAPAARGFADQHPPVREAASGRRARRLRGAVVPVLLLVLCWCAHYSRSAGMGFYEDDHYFAAATMAWTPADLCRWVWGKVAQFPNPQGRPVGFILGGLLPYVGYHVAGLAGMHAVAFAVVGGNGVLFYLLLKRCLAPPMPLVAAVAFVLFPADTTRPFLCHAHILFPAVTLTLVASHLYLNGTARSRVAAYAVATLAVLTYETALLPFLALPLLRRAQWDLRWAGAFAVHLAVIGLLAVALFAARELGGESRAVTAAGDLRTIAAQVGHGTLLGNQTVWSMCGRRALQGWYDIHDRRPRVAALAPLIVAVVWLGVPRRRATAADLSALAADIRRAVAFALAGSAVAYVFCFAPPHYPPTFTEGRLTSTHLAATTPVCVLMAVVVALPLLLFPLAGVPRWLGAAALAVVAGGYFTAVYAVALDEQDGYVAIWQARRQFWTALLDLCPDVGDHTIVVCDGRITPPAYYMGANSWSDYMVLMQCYRVPGGHFHRDPMVFVYPAGDGWTANLVRHGDAVIWQDGPEGLANGDARLDPGNLILLHLSPDNVLTRQTAPVTLCGRPFPLRQPPTNPRRPPYPTLPMYHLLTGSDG